CSKNEATEKALETFKQMHLVCVKPESTTFASVLPACAKMEVLEHGYAHNRFIVHMTLFVIPKHIDKPLYRGLVTQLE
ncbi:hypothetical protein KI387_013183, partial [Taxus chinensis]